MIRYQNMTICTWQIKITTSQVPKTKRMGKLILKSKFRLSKSSDNKFTRYAKDLQTTKYVNISIQGNSAWSEVDFYPLVIGIISSVISSIWTIVLTQRTSILYIIQGKGSSPSQSDRKYKTPTEAICHLHIEFGSFFKHHNLEQNY